MGIDTSEPLEKSAYSFYQRTIAQEVSFHGVGVHSGAKVSISVEPLDADQGIIFETSHGRRIAARAKNLLNDGHALCTVIHRDKDRVMTIEHIMAAFAACGIDNALVRLDHAEMPIMDGSAAPFVKSFAKVGARVQSSPRRFLRICKPWRIESDNGDWIAFRPLEKDVSSLQVTIDFRQKIPAVGVQKFTQKLVPSEIRDQIMPSRTFGSEQERLQVVKLGLALGASHDNALMYDGDRLLNSGGLRFADECVRHKMLDLIGDLFLSGWPLVGHVEAYRPSHRLNGLALKGLLSEGAAEFSLL